MSSLLTTVAITRATASDADRSVQTTAFFTHMRDHAARYVRQNPHGDGVCLTRDTCNYLRHVLEVCLSEVNATERSLAEQIAVSVEPKR